jgi:hypothetical protein
MATPHLDQYRQEFDYFRADLPILNSDKIERRCRTLSLLLTAPVRNGEITTAEIGEARGVASVRRRGGLPCTPGESN